MMFKTVNDVLFVVFEFLDQRKQVGFGAHERSKSNSMHTEQCPHLIPFELGLPSNELGRVQFIPDGL